MSVAKVQPATNPWYSCLGIAAAPCSFTGRRPPYTSITIPGIATRIPLALALRPGTVRPYPPVARAAIQEAEECVLASAHVDIHLRACARCQGIRSERCMSVIPALVSAPPVNLAA